MIPKKGSYSNLFSLIVFWVKKAMESSGTTSRRNYEGVNQFDLDPYNASFISLSITRVCCFHYVLF
jgi:hypothetical protein